MLCLISDLYFLHLSCIYISYLIFKRPMDGNYAQLLGDVRSVLECPVCLTVPRQVPVPACPAGHVVCGSCRRHVTDKCPTCRRKMQRGDVNYVAAALIEKIPHPCKFDHCEEKASLAIILEHEKICPMNPRDYQDAEVNNILLTKK